MRARHRAQSRSSELFQDVIEWCGVRTGGVEDAERWSRTVCVQMVRPRAREESWSVWISCCRCLGGGGGPRVGTSRVVELAFYNRLLCVDRCPLRLREIANSTAGRLGGHRRQGTGCRTATTETVDGTACLEKSKHGSYAERWLRARGEKESRVNEQWRSQPVAIELGCTRRSGPGTM